MLDSIKDEDVLFLDIETVPLNEEFEQLPEKLQALWDKKSSRFRDEEQTASDVYQRAGIFAEFGKIICISAGYIHKKSKVDHFRVKSFYGDDEKLLIKEFFKLLKKSYSSKKHLLCAHNGKEFDFPYIARRALINGIKLPSILDIAGKKPWEVKHLDTLELWKFGDYKNYTSLNLLTTIFDIPTPKDDIDGSQVCDVYYKEKNLDRIVVYCEKDVLAVAQLYLRYKCRDIIPEENVERV